MKKIEKYYNMKKDFETLKQEILKKAKEKKVCRGGYKRFLDVENINEAQEVILDNFDFVISKAIITLENAKYFEKLKVIDNTISFQGCKYTIDKDNILYEKYEDGQLLIKANYKDGKLNGLWQTWDENGQKLEKSNFKDDNLHGIYEVWYDDGQLWEKSNYKDDKLHGLYEMWDSDGKQRIKGYYIENKEVTKKEWEEYNKMINE